MRIAIAGYGNVAKPLLRLIRERQPRWTIAGIHTGRHGTALAPTLTFGPRAQSIDAFLDAAPADVFVELTPLNPSSGEPAISHIRAAFARLLHVVTANKGPLAFAYAALRDEAAARALLFRHESVIMDGAPVFNMVRHCLPGVTITGFTGALNSTSTIVIDAMERGGSFDDGIAEARRLGLTEADPAFDTDGWDSAAKTAALANVFLDANTTPLAVSTRGIGRLTTARVRELAAQNKTVRIISRAKRTPFTARVRAEVLDKTDPLAIGHGSSNLLLFHTDLMGTLGSLSINAGVEQTAYGVYQDLIEIARLID